jgi:hypothetical protein
MIIVLPSLIVVPGDAAFFRMVALLHATVAVLGLHPYVAPIAI